LKLLLLKCGPVPFTCKGKLATLQCISCYKVLYKTASPTQCL